MGIWTWLDRYDAQSFTAAAGSDGDSFATLTAQRDAAGYGHAGATDTHRAWHALHVALTGELEGGEPPACWVVWTSPGAREATMTSAFFVHSPDTVAAIADHLRGVVYDQAVARLQAAIERGVEVYSFNGWAEGSLLQNGLLRSVFDSVVKFYTAAAAQGQIVVVHRG